MSYKNSYIVDSETLIYKWEHLEDLKDTNLLLSVSNYYSAKARLVKILDLYKDDYVKKTLFVSKNEKIIKILSDSELTKIVMRFANTNLNCSTAIEVFPIENKLGISLFKDVYLENKENIEIHPDIDEVVAFAMYKKQLGSPVPILTMRKEIIDYCVEFNCGVDIIDIRTKSEIEKGI